jgi:hypothetical protein
MMGSQGLLFHLHHAISYAERKAQMSSSASKSPAHLPPLPIILVLPPEFDGAGVVDWQKSVQTFLTPYFLTQVLEWEWVNEELITITVDSLRDLLSRGSFGQQPNHQRLVVVLGSDLMLPAAQNTLLKSLEESPAQTTFVLATTQPANLLPTVLSRAHRLQLSLANEVTSTSVASPELQSDIEWLGAVADHAAESQLFSSVTALAARYKDRPSAKILIQRTVLALHQEVTTLTPIQIKLAQQALLALEQLDKNQNPSLVLEHWILTSIGKSA